MEAPDVATNDILRSGVRHAATKRTEAGGELPVAAWLLRCLVLICFDHSNWAKSLVFDQPRVLFAKKRVVSQGVQITESKNIHK